MTKKNLVLILFLVLKFALQYVLLSSEYDLQRDEYLHLDQAKHLAWGFQSVPPFTSWVSYIILLLGNSIFWIKFFPALFGALTLLIVWKAIETLNGNLFALILGATCILLSALLRLNTLYQPNSFDVLSWTALYFVIVKYIQTENSKWLYMGAIVFAIGFLNKYNIAFLLLGFIPAILLTEHKKLLLNPKLYLAVLLGLAIVLPNIFWQYQNNFPVFHHLKELAETQLQHVNRFDFLKSQILFFIGGNLVILFSFYALLFYTAFKKYKVYFFSIVITLITFVYFKAKDYYAIGLYPIYIAFGAVYLSSLLQGGGWKKYARVILIAMPILLFIPIYKVAFPNKSPEYIIQHAENYKKLGLLRWEDGKDHLLPQDFADMLGWKQLAEKVDTVCSTLPNLENTLILCDNYGQAGAINYYTKNNNIIASSLNADYVNWINYDKKITHIVLVKEPHEDGSWRKVIPLFDTCYLANIRANQYAREDTISIYVLKNAKTNINNLIQQEANKKKNYQ